MDNKFDIFLGKVKGSNILNRDDVVDIVGTIVELKPKLPEYVDNDQLSKLIDNEIFYKSEDEKFDISVYFRESDKYIDEDGNITYGDFKNLYRISIKKKSNFRFGDVKDFVKLTSNVIKETFNSSSLIIKIDDKRINYEEISDTLSVECVKIIIRIK